MSPEGPIRELPVAMRIVPDWSVETPVPMAISPLEDLPNAVDKNMFPLDPCLLEPVAILIAPPVNSSLPPLFMSTLPPSFENEWPEVKIILPAIPPLTSPL